MMMIPSRTFAILVGSAIIIILIAIEEVRHFTGCNCDFCQGEAVSFGRFDLVGYSVGLNDLVEAIISYRSMITAL
ncbi:unnamed protein product [Dracunculus medinensis]|uniref:Ion_trans_2 domain-containing protein n=1 Tax=Dracunculus medinensis TaxID=318479 RepID=A0A0N4UE82_DRAME|nr:unnamed protein product [Dracunculus medinensis]